MSNNIVIQESTDVVSITKSDNATVSTLTNNGSSTLIESINVELLSIETPGTSSITTIQGDTEQLVIERKTIEIIEVINNNCPDELKNPVFTYDVDTLIGIEYDNGGSKTLSYLPNGQLDTISFLINGLTILKQLNYDLSGKLTSITQTEA